MADRVLQTTLRVQTAQFDGGMLNSARALEKFTSDARSMGRFVSQTFGQLATPTERLELQIAKLDTVMAKGKITADEHSRAIKRLETDYNRAAAAAIELAKAEQSTRFLGRFNESRASLAAGESRAEIVARMSGGSSTSSGGLGPGGMGRDLVELGATAKLLKIAGLGDIAKTVSTAGKFGAAGIGAMGIHALSNRAREIADGDQSAVLSAAFGKNAKRLAEQATEFSDAFEKAKKGFLDGLLVIPMAIASIFSDGREFTRGKRLDAEYAAAGREGNRRKKFEEGFGTREALRLQEEDVARSFAQIPRGAHGDQIAKDMLDEAIAQAGRSGTDLDRARAEQIERAINDRRREGISLIEQEKAAQRAAIEERKKVFMNQDRELKIATRVAQTGESANAAAAFVDYGAGFAAIYRDKEAAINAQIKVTEDRRKSVLESEKAITREMERQKKVAEERDRFHERMFNSVRGFAQNEIEANKTPEERFADQQKRIRDAVATGQLDDEQARRAFDRSAAELRSNKDNATQLAPLLAVGSREAANYIAQLQSQKSATPETDRLVEEERKQLEAAKETRDAVKDLITVVEESFANIATF